jgi:5'(3')-deoxyribonucleotidase
MGADEMKNKTIYVDIDGCVADIARAYKEAFFRDINSDDPFTVQQYCQQIPYFFRTLPVIEKGRLLIELLKDDGYKVTFLTTPMESMPSCKRDKLEWIKENFGESYDVIFSDKKQNYVEDESSILIDDMSHNIRAWSDAGGTAIDFNKNSIDKIFEIIEEANYGKKEIAEVKEQLQNIDVDLEPTEKEKLYGNYKKGDILFKKMKLKIENPKGSIRFGWNTEGIRWISKMKNHYGYILGTEGFDLDPVDFFLGDKINVNKVFVVNQLQNGIFDECKIILGAETIEEAKKIYLQNYEKGWEKNILSIIPTNTKILRDWLKLKSHDPFV